MNAIPNFLCTYVEGEPNRVKSYSLLCGRMDPWNYPYLSDKPLQLDECGRHEMVRDKRIFFCWKRTAFPWRGQYIQRQRGQYFVAHGSILYHVTWPASSCWQGPLACRQSRVGLVTSLVTLFGRQVARTRENGCRQHGKQTHFLCVFRCAEVSAADDGLLWNLNRALGMMCLISSQYNYVVCSFQVSVCSFLYWNALLMYF